VAWVGLAATCGAAVACYFDIPRRAANAPWIVIGVMAGFSIASVLVYRRIRWLMRSRIDLAGELLQQWIIVLFVLLIGVAMLTGRPKYAFGVPGEVLFFLLALPLSNPRFAIFSGLMDDLVTTGVPEQFITKRRLKARLKPQVNPASPESSDRRTKMSWPRLLRAIAVGQVVIAEDVDAEKATGPAATRLPLSRVEVSESMPGLGSRLLTVCARFALAVFVVMAGYAVWQWKKTTPQPAAANVVAAKSAGAKQPTIPPAVRVSPDQQTAGSTAK
jgi:hypothetical protein